MISQRPTESDEEYEKRKRRVKLSMMGALAHGGGSVSTVLSAILYNMDTFNVDTLLRTIDNAGSEGAISDAPMYGSNHIDLQATMSVAYTAVSGSDYVYFDVTTKSHVSGTAGASTVTLSSPTHHSNFCSLKGGATVSAGDLTELDANPEDIARIADGKATVGTYSFSLIDIEKFYPCNEGLVGGAYVNDVISALGTERTTDIHSANIGTSGTVSASSVFSVGTEYKAFDDSLANTSKWQSSSTSGVGWLQYEFNTAVSINTFRYYAFITDAGTVSPNRSFKDFTFEVSNDGVTWIVVKTIAGATILDTARYSELYTIGVPLIAKYCRINITANHGDTYMGTQEFEINYQEAPVAEIINYASTCRTNLDLTNYGASNFLYNQDAIGRFIGMADAGTIVGASDGRNVDIAMTIPYNHLVTKDIDKIEGTLLSSTITYVDTTTEVVP